MQKSDRRRVRDLRAGVMALVLGSLLLSTGCRTRAGAHSSASAPPAMAVSLSRAACFGSCPVYSVELFTDGTVRFEGRAHVADTGSLSARVPQDSVHALVRSLRASPHLKADGSWVEGAPGCGRHVPDGPRFTLAVYADGPQRTVQFDAGCIDAPRALSALADEVDRIGSTAKWLSGLKETN